MAKLLSEKAKEKIIAWISKNHEHHNHANKISMNLGSGKIRRNKFISVLNYPLKIFSGASRNFKYCNDNPECLNIAHQKADTGQI
jgi:hypothetical protein